MIRGLSKIKMIILEYQAHLHQMIHNRNTEQTFHYKKKVIYQGCLQPRQAKTQQENSIDIIYNIIIILS
jgi:hypothetical protein